MVIDARSNQGRPASVKDVAALAGVSPKTVSNVVNGHSYVTAQTRERVERAIAELGYRPNLTARQLRSGRTGLLSLAVPRLDLPYFAELARSVVDAAGERGYTVLVEQTLGRREREMALLAGDRAQLVDGVLFSPIALGRADLADLADRRDRTPLVLLGERISAGPADHVAVDNVAAARTATEHLLSLGRKHIAAIGHQPEEEGAPAHLRLAGYRNALEAAGIRYRPTLVARVADFDRADGAAAMAGLLRGRVHPDAVFCFSDLLALGAMRTLYDAGLRVPDDITVVGFDDINEGRYSMPSLTTIAPNKDEIARIAVTRLVERITGADTGPTQDIVAGYRLAARESTLGRDRR